ncbi:Translocation and assembly module TamA precursor [Novipirellula galeiformis]|uniref:Translocation and assembly module TamA n=1 Tax=Novipirellula galeiformis TaxID=2528004 RepID=A0A5C6CX49_9BACT|nr:BamA/TamA family outer membrane protein [Novipirellula galeiformis]TWU27199.1 Translocation and assembly module TamA precursor [Novipirellula galeiformis]
MHTKFEHHSSDEAVRMMQSIEKSARNIACSIGAVALAATLGGCNCFAPQSPSCSLPLAANSTPTATLNTSPGLATQLVSTPSDASLVGIPNTAPDSPEGHSQDGDGLIPVQPDSDRYVARQYPSTPAYTSPPSLANPSQSNSGGSVYGAPQSSVPPSSYAPSTQYGAPSYPDTTFGPPTNTFPGASYPDSGTLLPYGDDPYGGAPSSVPMPTVREADLIINGFPARTGRIMLGGAVNSDAGVTGQITIDERNFDIMRWPRSFQDLFSGTAFRGAGQTFRIEMAPGSDFDRYTINFADPNLFGYKPVSMSVSGFLVDRRFNDWDEERLGGRLSFGYRITPDLSISMGVSGQSVDITRPRVRGIAPLEAVLHDNVGRNDLYAGTMSLKHDTRDSPIQSSQGHYFEFSFEQAFGDFDYSRFELEYRKYWLLSQRADGSGRQTLSYSNQLGFSGEDTPLFENFFAGGYATLRGFDFRGASPVVTSPSGNVEVGGRFKFLNTVEYMFPITADDAFKGVAFVDFGTVESDIELHKDSFRVAPGMGLRVAIPMLGPAPLAFDFAYPVTKAPTDDTKIFSFYMSLIR